MDIDAIKSSPIGKLVPIAGFDQRTGEEYEHSAYLPDLLPSDVALSSATWTSVAQAEAALGRLDEASQQVPEPGLLRRAATRREAQSTSALEGTFAPIEEVLEPDLEDRSQLSLQVWEILNYVAAAEEGLKWISSRPITSGLICQLQRVLVAGTPGEHSDSGGIRDRQVVVGPRDASVKEARFVPPPPGDQLQSGLDQWVHWVTDPPNDLPPVVRAAMSHYQFESLHPFSDGNGRIGRLLIVLELMRDAVLREPILVVSPWFESRRMEYQDHLLDLSRTGDWDRWIRFFAQGVGAAADVFRQRIEELIAWREQAIDTVRSAKVSGVAEHIAGDLIGSPILRAPRVARDHHVTPQGAMKALERLTELGLLTERKLGGRRSFRAERVIELIEFSF